jgi:hypothetical protein
MLQTNGISAQDQTAISALPRRKIFCLFLHSRTTRYVDEYLFGPTGAGNPNISGFYFDDDWSMGGSVKMYLPTAMLCSPLPCDGRCAT